jgi:hypothetical protein
LNIAVEKLKLQLRRISKLNQIFRSEAETFVVGAGVSVVDVAVTDGRKGWVL